MPVLPEIKHILYCTQIGPNSAYIFRYAVSLAEKYGARITVLHVVPTLPPEKEALIDGWIGPASIHDLVEREEQAAVGRIHQHLEAFCQRLTAGLACGKLVERILIREGEAAQEIIAEAIEARADLIVMGAHATSTLVEAIMGSTARKVLRKSPVPVLVVQVPEGQQELTEKGI